jgi:N utilization substance protein B
MSGRRSHARRYAVLALYQWQLTGQSPAEIGRHFFDDPAWVGEVADSLADLGEEGVAGPIAADAVFDPALFEELLHGVPRHLTEIDRRLQSALDRPIAQITPVELAILRLATYELLHSPAVPYRVVINEAVELAKLFGADDNSHRYVNGVLDRIAREVRTPEAGGGMAVGSGPRAPCLNSI